MENNTDNNQEDITLESLDDNNPLNQRIPNRKFRRMMMRHGKYISIKNKLNFKDWLTNISVNINNGRTIHTTNTEFIIKRFNDDHDKRYSSLADHLKADGRFSDNKIAEIIQNNMNIDEKLNMRKIK